MLLLDTNVISELRKPKANHGVKAWAYDIAATALVHGLTVVTRNITDFEACGVRLLNPWKN